MIELILFNEINTIDFKPVFDTLTFELLVSLFVTLTLERLATLWLH